MAGGSLVKAGTGAMLLRAGGGWWSFIGGMVADELIDYATNKALGFEWEDKVDEALDYLIDNLVKLIPDKASLLAFVDQWAHEDAAKRKAMLQRALEGEVCRSTQAELNDKLHKLNAALNAYHVPNWYIDAVGLPKSLTMAQYEALRRRAGCAQESSLAMLVGGAGIALGLLGVAAWGRR